jgi:putative photosynthetic complex assembly protein
MNNPTSPATSGPASAPTSPPLPAPFLAAGVLVIASIVAVSAVRLSGVSIHTPDAAPVIVRQLHFDDRPDGSIAVFDAANQRQIATVEGQAGFVRGTLRGLARERHRQGIGAEQPFQLIGRADGRLTLLDPATSRRVDLESFGPTNAGDFARFLAPESR